MSIFKAYDIRGIYPDELNEDIAYKIGRAIAKFLKVKRIAVGRDMRISSPALFKAVSKGIMDEGSDVIDIGLVSTPMTYFACNFLKAHASVTVSASHNPPKYNGFKLTREKAVPISGDTGIKDIERIFNQDSFKSKAKIHGRITKKDVLKGYIKHVLAFIDKDRIKQRKLKIVIDTANGMAGQEVPLVFKNLPFKIIPLYFKLDGRFPNHEADPLKDKNCMDCINKVKKEKADLGVCFDGDADRVFFITEEGEKVGADFITALIAESMLKKKKENRGAAILYDIRSSWIVKEVIEKNKGKASMSKVGHAFIKEQLRRENGIFGGELSGHFYFRDNFYSDSAIIACLKVIEIMCDKGKKLSELVKPLKRYCQSGEINSEVADKEGKIRELGEKYKDGRTSRLDGIRVDYKDWWFNVRPSNTEPLLRLNLEARTKKLMKEKLEEILGLIRS